MDLFRGVLAKGEYSERVLTLTEELLSMNPGSYTVWYASMCVLIFMGIADLKFSGNIVARV